MDTTVFWNKDGYSSLYRALYIDFISVQTIEIFGLGLSASLNFCLILDLIFMMKSPFANKGQYMTKYLLISPLVAFAFAIGVTIQTLNSKKNKVMFWLISIVYIAIYTTGIYSIFIANQMLSKPGISASVRKLIMKRHTAGIILFIVCNLYTLGYCLQVSIKGKVDETTTPVYQLILKAIYFSSGLLGPLLRLNEPAFLHAA
jgi:hypothetical protein